MTTRHKGPGPHPSGTDQDVHGGKGGGGSSVLDGLDSDQAEVVKGGIGRLPPHMPSQSAATFAAQDVWFNYAKAQKVYKDRNTYADLVGKLWAEQNPDKKKSRSKPMQDFICRMTTRPVEIKRSKEDGPTTIRGYAAVSYNGTDSTEFRLFEDVRERMLPGAFDDQPLDMRSTFNHDPNMLLGRQSAGTLKFGTDSTGLWYEVTPPETRRDVIELIERGDVDGSSFWFKVLDDEKRSDGQGGVIWEIRKVEIREMGPVTFPAYEATTAQMRSAAGLDPARAEIDAWLEQRAAKKANDLEYAKTVVRSLE